MLKLFSPYHVKAVSSPLAQAIVSAGEIIVLGAIPSVLTALTEYITKVMVFNLSDFITFAGITILLALLKATATYLTAKGSPMSVIWGSELMAFEAALAQKMQSGTVQPPATNALSYRIAPVPGIEHVNLAQTSATIPQSVDMQFTAPMAAIETARQAK